ncbi:type II toxin-antitoxin system RelE/ParE family toxin [Pseudooceanicola nanhaiensis]|uniref:type II toxin-antitoxin system RelE/ParE family toxin n=1 Tax=Pseudooceanicola nanhaiensis TaxID=375761 RepID=UPI001CD605B9|nr:type II toxin-antitoxin system RelE/ParE family toxin [Pseudooceanicola nanhaiensis]MCA0922507.1 type II toxin-antitoxin system RelE/ParE family toxin [Pseudooceanicola nanhaiensis]
MVFDVRRAAGVARDLELIFDFIAQSAEALGEPPEEAFTIAARRIGAILDAMERLGQAPYQGTRRPDLGPNIRHVTKDRAIFYFALDEEAERLDVLAVFFGGQDHDARILLRLLAGS